MDADTRPSPEQLEQALEGLEAAVRRLQNPEHFTEPKVRAIRGRLKRLTQAIAQTKGARPLAGRVRALKVELQRLDPNQVPQQRRRRSTDAVYAHPRPRDTDLAHRITHGHDTQGEEEGGCG